MLAQVISVGTVDDRVEPALRRNFVQPRPELRFAVIAAIRRITEITRISQLVGVNLHQRDVELPRELVRCPGLDLRIRRTAPHNRNKSFGTQHRSTYDSQNGRVHAARVAEDDAAESLQVSMQLLEFRHGEKRNGEMSRESGVWGRQSGVA